RLGDRGFAAVAMVGPDGRRARSIRQKNARVAARSSIDRSLRAGLPEAPGAAVRRQTADKRSRTCQRGGRVVAVRGAGRADEVVHFGNFQNSSNRPAVTTFVVNGSRCVGASCKSA